MFNRFELAGVVPDLGLGPLLQRRCQPHFKSRLRFNKLPGRRQTGFDQLGLPLAGSRGDVGKTLRKGRLGVPRITRSDCNERRV